MSTKTIYLKHCDYCAKEVENFDSQLKFKSISLIGGFMSSGFSFNSPPESEEIWNILGERLTGKSRFNTPAPDYGAKIEMDLCKDCSETLHVKIEEVIKKPKDSLKAK